jgi:hypothetical protein
MWRGLSTSLESGNQGNSEGSPLVLERRSRNQPLEIYLKYIKWISEMEKDLLLLLQGNTPL